MSVPGAGWTRWRAPLGYPTAALCLWLAHPTFISASIGSALALAGLLIRASAAGHLRKREALAHTGPYAHTRNPLYLGSALMAAGFAVAQVDRGLQLVCWRSISGLFMRRSCAEKSRSCARNTARRSTITPRLCRYSGRDYEAGPRAPARSFHLRNMCAIVNTRPPLAWPL